jgi:hypothetical protein
MPKILKLPKSFWAPKVPNFLGRMKKKPQAAQTPLNFNGYVGV